MAYPAYDTYNQGVAFPMSRRQSMAYTDGYAMDPAAPLAGGAYGEVGDAKRVSLYDHAADRPEHRRIPRPPTLFMPHHGLRHGR